MEKRSKVERTAAYDTFHQDKLEHSIWRASATESSGSPSSAAVMRAVPAKLALSRFVVRGMTRTD
jgi:hypothetical protein